MATRNHSTAADDVFMSDEDLDLLDRYQTQYQTAKASGNRAGMSAAHDAAEALRAKYNYSGGSDGSDYIQLGTAPSFNYQSAPSYVSRYQDQIDTLSGQLLNREPFSYDYASDPAWQSYKKQYTREGQRAAADTLGQYAAMTGGMPSTAAVTASQQAGDYYAAQLADKIPELQQLAYSMYLNEGNRQLQNLNALRNLENDDYSRYLNSLNQYNNDRAFAYGVYGDDRAHDYQAGRDAIADARYADETAYSRSQTSGAEARSRIDAYLAAGGDPEALDPDLVFASGYTAEELAVMRAYYAQQAAGTAMRYFSGKSAADEPAGAGGNRPLKYADLSEKGKQISDLMDSELTTDYSGVIHMIEALTDRNEQDYLLRQLDAYL